MICPVKWFSGETASVLAGLFSVSSMVFWRGGDDETHQASNEAKKRFLSELGDIVTIYKVFTEWTDHKQADRSLKSINNVYLFQQQYCNFFYSCESLVHGKLH